MDREDIIRSLKISLHRKDVSSIPDAYDMSHPERGVALIIINVNFDVAEQREGSGTDGDRIEKCLRHLGFEVRRCTDLTKQNMKELITNVSREDHSDRDCFVCVMMSHGDNDVIHATDGAVSISDITDPFKGHTCPTLAGKPKIFFIQACRGQNFDFGSDVTDGVVQDEDHIEPITYKTPREADFLLAFSSVSGYYSWRHIQEGSVFIQALCEVLENNGSNCDLLTLLTRVNKLMAHGLHIHVKSDIIQKQLILKQIPSFQSTLTKDVILVPKE